MPTFDEFSARPKPAAAEHESRIRELETRITELEKAKTWLEQQVANWQSAADERDSQIHELKTWIAELEKGKVWLDEQRRAWQRLAEEREQQLRQMPRPSWPAWLSPRVLLDRLHQTPQARPIEPQPEASRPTPALPSPALPTTSESPAGPFARPRQVLPLSREWGFDRGPPIDRYYIEGFLARNTADICGRVLEIGDNRYTLRFGGDRVVKSDVLDIAADNPAATIVADLAQADHLPSDVFDCIIFTQTLHFIYDARAALRTLWRILKPGGTLLATCPGLTPISQTELPGSWHWRFTAASIKRLLEEVQPKITAEVNSHGNVLAACAFLYGLAAEELRPEELDYHDRNYEVILTIRAAKPEAKFSAASAETGHAHLARRQEARALVLMYHRVVAGGPDPWALSVTPEHFDEQLQVLQRDFQPIWLQDLAQGPQHHASQRAHVAVTFDDGYADNLHQALPLLERYRVPATFFLTTGGIAQRAEFWWDTLERLLLLPGTLPATLQLSIDGQQHQWDLGEWENYSEAEFARHQSWLAWQPPPTSRQVAFLEIWQLLRELLPETRRSVLAEIKAWAGPGVVAEPRHRALGLDELEAMARSELVNFGAHTVNHPSLARLPLAMQRAEIFDSQRWLQEALGRDVRSFSYPFGRPVDFSPDTIALVREAGFEFACVTQREVVRPDTDRWQLPRFQVENWDGDEFERRLSRWFSE